MSAEIDAAVEAIDRAIDGIAELRRTVAANNAEIEELKSWVVTFLVVHAVKYAEDHGLNGLYPTHYDMLARCGARMVDFKRACIPEGRS